MTVDALRRRPGTAAAAIAAVAIGGALVFGTGWLRTPASGEASPAVVVPPTDASASSTRSPSTAAATIASPTPSVVASPTPSVGASPGSTEETLPCTQLGRTTGTAVEFIGGVVPGDAIGYLGNVVAWGTGAAADGNPAAWGSSEGLAEIQADPSTKLRFVGAEQLYCISSVTAEVRPAGTTGAGVALPGASQEPAASIDLAPPGIGAWQVRVRVGFAGTTGTTWTIETFVVDVHAPAGSPPG